MRSAALRPCAFRPQLKRDPLGGGHLEDFVTSGSSFRGMLFALCVVCGHLSSQATPVALPSCTTPGVGTPDSVWRQVRAAGFSFCVPASWQPRGHAHDTLDATRWNAPGGSYVTWGRGRPRDERRAEITGRIGRINHNPSPTPSPVPPQPEPCAQSNTPVTVEGGILLVSQVHCHNTWTITAFSTTPPIYLKGEAHSQNEAERLLLVIQTVQFPSSSR